jgi:hypothetical protein
MPKRELKIWEVLHRVAILSHLLSTPATIGIAWIIGVMSANVPFISAFGLFGISVTCLAAFLILSLCMFLQSKTKPKSRTTYNGELKLADRIFRWKGWQWVILITCAAVGCCFLDLHPALPAGWRASDVTHPIASYKELRSNRIVGKSVLLSAVPRTPGRFEIADKRFEQCEIMGPIVVAPSECDFWQNIMVIPDGNIESILLETKSHTLIGVVGLVHCQFIQCTFGGLSFIGDADSLNNLRKNTGFLPVTPWSELHK